MRGVEPCCASSASSHAALPAAFVLTAECDPLRNAGESDARRLAETGVPVVQRRYEGMIHGFLALTDVLEPARVAVSDVARELRRALSA